MDIRKALNPAKVLFSVNQRIDKYMEGEREFPPWSVEIQPTAVCNFDCIYCSYAIRNESGARLEATKFFSLIDDLCSMGVKSVYFAGGGEPLLYRGLETASERLADNNVKQALLTNGSNIRLLRKIVDKVSYVLVHIAAFDSNVYKQIMRFDQKSHIFNLPTQLKEVNRSLVVGARIVLINENINHTIETIRKLKDAGFDYVICTPVADFEDRNLIPLNYDYYDNLANLQQEPEFLTGFAVMQPKNQSIPQPICWCLEFNLGAICDPHGDIYLSISSVGRNELSIGNIHSLSFQEIWGGEKHRYIKQIMQNRCQQGECNNCRYIGYNRVIDNFMEAQNSLHREFL